MPFLEIRQSGPDIPDGVYPVMLIAIKGDPQDPNAPRHVVPEQGPNAGKDLYFWDWNFALNLPDSHPLTGTEIEYGTSTATGPRSKMYGVLTALLNGARPTVGSTFEKDDLIGRQALATIQRDEAGYCRITNLSAMPAQMQQQAYAAATAAPVAPPAAPAPVAAPVATQPAPAAAAPLAAAGLPIQQVIPPQPQPAGPLPNQVADAAGGFGVAGVQAAAGQPLRDQVAPPERPNDALPF